MYDKVKSFFQLHLSLNIKMNRLLDSHYKISTVNYIKTSISWVERKFGICWDYFKNVHFYFSVKTNMILY